MKIRQIFRQQISEKIIARQSLYSQMKSSPQTGEGETLFTGPGGSLIWVQE